MLSFGLNKTVKPGQPLSGGMCDVHRIQCHYGHLDNSQYSRYVSDSRILTEAILWESWAAKAKDQAVRVAVDGHPALVGCSR